MLTLDQFLGQDQRSAWLRHDEFKDLYVRKTERFYGRKRVPTIDLATITARKPGRGSFKRLVAYLRANYPAYALYVENVLSPRFADSLPRMGFTLDFRDAVMMPSFYLLPSVKRTP